jgi:hypothetical protein
MTPDFSLVAESGIRTEVSIPELHEGIIILDADRTGMIETGSQFR